MRQKKKKSRIGVAVAALLAVAVLIGAVFLMLPGKQLSLSGINLNFQKEALPAVGAPPTFAGPVHAMTLSGGAAMLLGEDKSADAQKLALDAALDFAAQNGYEAVLWQGSAGAGQSFYRKGAAKDAVATLVSDCDKLFSQWDPLAYLCAGANKRALGVFVYFAPQDISEEAATALEKAYPLAGVYVNEILTIENPIASSQKGWVAYRGIGGEPTLYEANDTTGFAEAARLFQEESFGGFVFGEYSTLVGTGAPSALLALWNDAPAAAFTAYAPNNALTLTYPANTTKPLYTETCYLMGTSNPNEPLTINGTEVKRYGKSGAFGVLVNLAMGQNSFELAQTSGSVSFALTRAKSTYTGNANAADATVAAPAGQMVEIVSGIASGLTNPASDDKINETFKKGARFTVTNSTRTTRSGKKTWAYQLASGDWVLARNVKFIDSTRAAFAPGAATAQSGGESIPLAAGTPLCYTQWSPENSTLTITAYDADVPADFAITGSAFIIGTRVEPAAGGTAITLQLNPDTPLWGWDLRYENGATSLFLKKAPVQSQTPGKPLAGIRVMLDAGHGQDDYGALGVPGELAPVEKTVNLNVALAAQKYLEQLGATVLQTRSDDTFRTLDERLALQSTETPDLFIAVHHNSVELVVDANESRGTECYYFYKWHKPLAEALVSNIVDTIGRANREAQYGYYYVTRSTVAPSVLLEVGFMVNPAEYESITDPLVTDQTGAAIAEAILTMIPKA